MENFWCWSITCIVKVKQYVQPWYVIIHDQRPADISIVTLQRQCWLEYSLSSILWSETCRYIYSVHVVCWCIFYNVRTFYMYNPSIVKLEFMWFQEQVKQMQGTCYTDYQFSKTLWCLVINILALSHLRERIFINK